MLKTFNRRLETFMPLITPASVGIGLLLPGAFAPLQGGVPWIFSLITLAGSIKLGFGDFRKVASRPLPLAMTLLTLHLVMPLLALAAGRLFFPREPLLVTGMVLLALIPTGVVSFMWVSIYRGFIALTLSILLIDTFLSPFAVPWALAAFIGTDVEIDTWGMMQGLLYMVVLPSLVGMLLNRFCPKTAIERFGTWTAPLSKLLLELVIVINTAVIAPYFRQANAVMLHAAGLIILLIACGYGIGRFWAWLFRWDRDTAVSLTFNSGMRNISAGAVLATTYFPAEVAYPAIIGMLVQQMTASLVGYVLFRRGEGGRLAKRRKGGPVAGGGAGEPQGKGI